jgi:hypothetical protein
MNLSKLMMPAFLIVIIRFLDLMIHHQKYRLRFIKKENRGNLLTVPRYKFIV